MRNTKLEALVKLVDDDTTEVREEVFNELNNYGYNLEQDLLQFSDILSQKQTNLLAPILEKNRQNWLMTNWKKLSQLDDDFEKLEFAMFHISKFQYGLSLPTNLTLILNEVANEFNNFYPFGNEIDLALFLFQQKGITGEKEEYYNPFNSNLLYTIENKKGIPITLSLLYMLVGYRLGFDIDGCNFPGHFLAKFNLDEEVVLVDGFNGGKLIYEHELIDMVGSSYFAIMDVLAEKTDPAKILRRVLTNLNNAYSKNENDELAEFFKSLAKIEI